LKSTLPAIHTMIQKAPRTSIGRAPMRSQMLPQCRCELLERAVPLGDRPQ
jgi:hypothetical protein